MLFKYTDETRHIASYRPDLHALISKWLAYVPAEVWPFFVAFRVGEHGEFIAKFMKAPDVGGPLRVITFTLDHHMCTMATDRGAMWRQNEPVRMTVANFDLAVNYNP
jgi:hypothetical protein